MLNKNADVVSWWAGQGVRRRQEGLDFVQRLKELDAQLAGATAGEEPRYARLPSHEEVRPAVAVGMAVPGS